MIYFDLDGVLADMESGLMQNAEVKALKEVVENLISTKFTEYKELVDDDIKTKFKAELESNPESEVKELKKAFSKYTSKVFSIASKPGFYRNLPLMPGAVEMVKKAGELSGELPNILSAPVGDENDLNNPSVVEKKEWVAEHFDKLVNEVIITIDKGKVVKSKDDILIDDRPKYVDKFESAGGTAILYKDSNQATAELVKLIGSKKPVVEKVTSKRWVKTFESFRMGRINEEVMDDLKDDKSIISWLEKNLEEYIDGLHDYGSGYNIIDKLSKLLVIVGLKLGRDKKFLTDYIDDSKFLEDDSKTIYNEYDEGSVEGSVSMNGTEIITYKCHSDGYGFGATIDSNRFEKEIIDFIKAMKNPE